MKANPDLIVFGAGLLLLAVGAVAAFGLAGLMAPGVALMVISVFGPRGESEPAP